MSVRVCRPRRRHAEQVSALVGLQLTSIVGVQPAQLAAQSGYFIVDPISPGRLRLFIAAEEFTTFLQAYIARWAGRAGVP